MKTTAVIIDDEEGARESLANILKNYVPEVEVLGKAASAHEGYDLIKKVSPQLVFLDVEMPNENAFDLIDKFDSVDFEIIFVTAYDHYAIQAIKSSALDYLLKPIDIDDLKSAVAKLEYKISQPQKDEQFDLLLDSVNSNKPHKKIAIPESDGLMFVDVNDILRCESDGNYTIIYLKSEKRVVSSKTLGDYAEILKNNEFFRTHRSHLINLNEIHKFVKGDGGYILMSDKSEVEISRRKKQEFLVRLAKF
jgi:two-component system, LytTR family, response regulator